VKKIPITAFLQILQRIYVYFTLSPVLLMTKIYDAIISSYKA